MFVNFFSRPEFSHLEITSETLSIEVIMERIHNLSHSKFCAGTNGVSYTLEYINAALERFDIYNDKDYVKTCFSTLLLLKEKIHSFQNSHEITKALLYSGGKYSLETLEENVDRLIKKASDLQINVNKKNEQPNYPYQLQDRMEGLKNSNNSPRK